MGAWGQGGVIMCPVEPFETVMVIKGVMYISAHKIHNKGYTNTIELIPNGAVSSRYHAQRTHC